MIRHRQRKRSTVLHEGPAMQRKPAGPQTALGVLPAQAASLQAPQRSVAVACGSAAKRGISAPLQAGPDEESAASGSAAVTPGACGAAGAPGAASATEAVRRRATGINRSRALKDIASSCLGVDELTSTSKGARRRA